MVIDEPTAGPEFFSALPHRLYSPVKMAASRRNPRRVSARIPASNNRRQRQISQRVRQLQVQMNPGNRRVNATNQLTNTSGSRHTPLQSTSCAQQDSTMPDIVDTPL